MPGPSVTPLVAVANLVINLIYYTQYVQLLRWSKRTLQSREAEVKRRIYLNFVAMKCLLTQRTIEAWTSVIASTPQISAGYSDRSDSETSHMQPSGTSQNGVATMFVYIYVESNHSTIVFRFVIGRRSVMQWYKFCKIRSSTFPSNNAIYIPYGIDTPSPKRPNKQSITNGSMPKK